MPPNQEDEDGVCKTCRGEGRGQAYTTDGQGMSAIVVKLCEDCGGTGLEPGDGDVD